MSTPFFKPEDFLSLSFNNEDTDFENADKIVSVANRLVEPLLQDLKEVVATDEAFAKLERENEHPTKTIKRLLEEIKVLHQALAKSERTESVPFKVGDRVRIKRSITAEQNNGNVIDYNAIGTIRSCDRYSSDICWYVRWSKKESNFVMAQHYDWLELVPEGEGE